VHLIRALDAVHLHNDRPASPPRCGRFKYADCLAAAVAVTSAPLNHGLGVWMPTSLGQRDPVQCGLELPVSGAAESVSGFVRFKSRDAYARYNGTAPLPVWSSAVSPMILAAVSGPQPGRARRVGASRSAS
jgi:hypothetical protein